MVEKFPGADTREISDQIEEKLADLKPGLGGMTIDTSVFRPATLIDHAIDNTLLALGIGLVLALLVLVAIVRSFRRVLVSAVAIVVSLVVAAAALVQFGETLNTLSVAGLALALVVLVDDAVAGVDKLVDRGSKEDSAVSIRDALDADATPAGLRDDHGCGRDRPAPGDGRTPGCVLRTARRRLPHRPRRGHGRGPDAHAGARLGAPGPRHPHAESEPVHPVARPGARQVAWPTATSSWRPPSRPPSSASS